MGERYEVPGSRFEGRGDAISPSQRSGAWGKIACMAAAGKFERRWIDAQEWALGFMHGLWIGLRQEPWARMRRGPATAAHLATGLAGERAAYFELKRRGLKVVARRWSNARMLGDLDLIGWDGDLLCFVEVKTRTARDLSPAESAVDEEKRVMVRNLARAYLRTMPETGRATIRVRFDVVSVYSMGGASEFEVFQNAFGWQ
jgi:putative endonuclease